MGIMWCRLKNFALVLTRSAFHDWVWAINILHVQSGDRRSGIERLRAAVYVSVPVSVSVPVYVSVHVVVSTSVPVSVSVVVLVCASVSLSFAVSGYG